MAALSVPSPPRASGSLDPVHSLPDKPSLKPKKRLRVSWKDEPALVAVRRFFKVWVAPGSVLGNDRLVLITVRPAAQHAVMPQHKRTCRQATELQAAEAAQSLVPGPISASAAADPTSQADHSS